MLTYAASIVYGTNTAYGMSLPISLEELLGQSQTVFVGTITTVEVLEFELGSRSNFTCYKV